jgi:hypothetical protein
MSGKSVLLGVALSLLSALSQASTPAQELADWTEVVRESPYWESKGVYTNIMTVRRWILESSSYCENTDRHIFFDRRGKFLGYMENAGTRSATQRKLNDTRSNFARRKKIEYWVPGSPSVTGYPFAVACDQPHVNLDQALGRYLGTQPGALIWGAWDDLRVGTQAQPKSLHNALDYIAAKRNKQQRLELPAGMRRYLAGQLLIESGGKQQAHSVANARGIMQLSPMALSDCGIAPRNYWHRLAQLDCAMRLTSQNARNLRGVFDQRFGDLPEAKRNRLFNLLLVQAYHGGASRVEALLNDPELSRPAIYFANHHKGYSAGDIAFGMVFHNLGRDRLGLASLYYVVDVGLATDALCRSPQLRKEALCNS